MTILPIILFVIGGACFGAAIYLSCTNRIDREI